MAELRRVLGYPVILLIVINSIMGTGIFFLPALGAKIAGPASLISWVILSFISVYIAACFGELASMFPKAGGIYEFSKQAYGRFASFLIGWLSLITANFTVAMLMIGAVKYLLPSHNATPVIIVSLILILMFNFTAYRGMKVSATLLVAFAFITLFAVLSVAVPGLWSFSISNLQPFAPFGFSAVFLAIFFVAETFFGWESPTYLAGEVKDGERVMPRALVHGTIIISIISLFFVLMAMGSYGWKTFGDSAAPLSALAGFHYGESLLGVFTIIVYLAVIGSVADWVVSAPRLILSMAKDKLFLRNFEAIHPKYGTPYKAILLQTAISSVIIIVGAGSYYLILEMLLPMLVLLYCTVLMSLVVLRYRRPDIKRHFTVPFGKVGPIIISGMFLSLLGIWLYHTEGAGSKMKVAILLLILGLPLYFLLEMFYDPKTISSVKNRFARFAVWFETFDLPASRREELILLLGDLKGKKVIEYGCGVGTLTLHLAERVKPGGEILAIALSEHEADVAHSRLLKKKHDHVKVFPAEIGELAKSLPKANAAVSAGTFGYVQDPQQFLLQLNKHLPVGGRVAFLDYDKFYDIIPNVEWLSDDLKIKRMFTKAGFSVEVVRRQGIAWQYLFIFGTKMHPYRKPAAKTG
jgi:APA family basic amino acid/polyamine antiporter/amino acid efflux transporter